LIAGMIFNEVSSENKLHQLIKKSPNYHIANKYKKNTLVHITDIITSKGFINDYQYIFNLKNIIILKKTVEMYQWRYKSRGKNSYYEKGWQLAYIDTGHKIFKNPKNKQPLGIFYYYPQAVEIGKIKLPIQQFKADSYLEFKLNNSLKDKHNHHLYLFFGTGALNAPDIGDVRIRYQGYEANQITTVFCTISNHGLSFANNTDYSSFYGNSLFKMLYKGNTENVITSFLEKENDFKNLMHFFLSFALFLILLKFAIVTFNILNPNGIQSKNKQYTIFLFGILPISFIITYLITNMTLLISYYISNLLS
jgi:hypothetical protein